MKKTMLFKKGKVILFYLTIIICLVISISMIIAKVNGKQPEIMGCKIFVVLTGSMEPEIAVGDMIIVRDIEPVDVNKEDIITYQSSESNNIITHRVKRILSNNKIEFITKGDANKVEDPNVVGSDRLIGKVIGHVPKVGCALRFIQNNAKAVLLIILAISIVFAFINGLKKTSLQRHNRKN